MANTLVSSTERLVSWERWWHLPCGSEVERRGRGEAGPWCVGAEPCSAAALLSMYGAQVHGIPWQWLLLARLQVRQWRSFPWRGGGAGPLLWCSSSGTLAATNAGGLLFSSPSSASSPLTLFSQFVAAARGKVP
jgi:hypothetical protein